MCQQASVYNMKETEPQNEKAEVPWRPMKNEEETKVTTAVIFIIEHCIIGETFNITSSPHFRCFL